MKIVRFAGRKAIIGAGALLACLALAGCAAAHAPSMSSFPSPPKMHSLRSFPDPPKGQAHSTPPTETAVLAGGCFWGMQGVFERVVGVTNTVVGFSGGKASTAHYSIVSTGTTNHAETIKITFNPKIISFGMLLKIFFSVAMNPTELDYQGPDHGPQYRSVIFYTSARQEKIARRYIDDLTKDKTFSKPIVTQLVPFKAFYRAAAYHQHFMDKHPNYPYIVIWDKPKVRALEKYYPKLISHPVKS